MSFLLANASEDSLSRTALKVSYGDDPSGIDGGVFINFFEFEGWNIIPNYGLAKRNDLGFGLFLNRWKKDHEKTQDYCAVTICATGDVNGIAYSDFQVSAVFSYKESFLPNPREKTLSHEVGHLQGLIPIGSKDLHVDDYVDALNWENTTHCLMSYKTESAKSKELDMDCIYRLRDGK